MSPVPETPTKSRNNDDQHKVKEVLAWVSVARLHRNLRPRLHKGKTQIFPHGLASHLHENPVFITENYYF